jgi:cell wall-associated NlpC family hydrolase
MKWFLFIIFITLFSGCSTKNTPYSAKKAKLHKIQKQQTNKKTPYKPKSKNYITTALYKEYKKWYKTPYKYGGCNTNGVDCSSLIQNIYKDAFNIKIPRTTKEQAKIGHKVSKSSMKEGDLVFFKTGYNSRHAGIIIERGKFIHTSTKYGVVISHINNPYWKSKYWQARRILP